MKMRRGESLRQKICRLEREINIAYYKVNKLDEENNNSGTSGPRVITTDSENYTLSNQVVTTILTFNGTASTLNLPPVSQTIGLIIILTNAGSDQLTITSPDGIWEGGMSMPSTNMDPGTTARVVNDGITYRINS